MNLLLYLKRGGMVWWLLIPVTLSAQHSVISAIKQTLPRITDSIAYVDALNRLAVLYQATQLDSCGAYADKAREMAIRIDYSAGSAMALRTLGSYYAFRPHRYLSSLFYKDALAASRAAGDTAGVVQTLMNLGLYHYYEGKEEKARSYIDRALQRTWKFQLDSLRALVLANYYLVNAGDSSRSSLARKALQQAGLLATRFHDHRTSLYVRLLRSDVMMRNGQVEAATVALKNVMDTAASQGLYYLAMHAGMQLADYSSRLHQADSLVYLQKATDYAVAGGYLGLLLRVTTQLYHYFYHHMDYARAAKYSRLTLMILVQQQEDMQKGEMDYLAYAQQDQILDSLRYTATLQTKQLHQSKVTNNYWFYLGVMIAVATLLLLLLFLYLLQLYRVSRRNTTQLVQLEEEIREKNETLQTNDDFKNKLISLIAHDFRTPLYNIVNITGFVDEDALTVHEAAEMMTTVEQTATSTLIVFEEILGWIRTQLSGFVYRPSSFMLADMLTAVLHGLQYLATDKGVTINLDILPGTQVYADFEMLQFIHRNFLHNAIKFSPSNAVITVTAIRIEGQLEVAFADEGRGIDAAILPYLFTHKSTAASGENNSKGAGVALIICRDFITKMKGTVGVSNNSGRGSTFFYRLPDKP
ncbi:sensor histidine kinase [Chitinophaga nivalis]|uniref:histidine kinase n=1 Tax=Chitinophaga nivalis TaxID=2991709 RepID=A0ABT3ITF2_9BACT|nr:HAMP domain-containing sensor histidine kinase [Chitinophaga nivalis]MCW3463310.1 HAMP domain-containing histidine kinase [Chitinophaga nivalis]MCW3487000.1 HAMP domain-containing histidine kinase [Chitinophaga nivalis]